jgi:hypothetical protein
MAINPPPCQEDDPKVRPTQQDLKVVYGNLVAEDLAGH